MVGKGWFVIYALLVFFVFYLFLSQRQQAADIRALQVELTRLQPDNPTPFPTETALPTPSPADTDITTTEGRDKKRKQDIEKIRTGLIAYHKEKKSYPTDYKLIAPQYIDTLPADPLDPKHTYYYRRPTPGTFILGCVLENKNDPDDAKDGKADGFHTLTEKST